MEKCFICKKGQLVKTASLYGEEIYCNSCRRIIVSTLLNFKFADSQPTDCKTSDGRPGFKGPGKKAVCHGYSNDEEKEAAMIKAKESEYAFQHRHTASKIVNSVAYFTGLPSFAGMNDNTGNTMATQESSNPNFNQPAVIPDNPIDGQMSTDKSGVAVQPLGDINNSSPLNSGTTSSKRLAELLSKELGPGFCTEHNSYTCGCNHNLNSQ